MTEESIKVFCRVRPVTGVSTTVEYEIENESLEQEAGTLEFFVPENFVVKYSQNSSLSYKYAFNQIFDQDAEQQQVFDHVAKPLIENALNGFNGTVFVYGQTSTGKTYTMIGDDFDVKPKAHSLKTKKNQRKYRHVASRVSHRRESVTSSNAVASQNRKNALTRINEENDQADAALNENEGIPTNSDQTDTFYDEGPADRIEEDSNSTNKDGKIKNTRKISSPSEDPSSGIIPRTLLQIFSALSGEETKTEVEVSYYEIYKETGYDLLNGLNEKRQIKDLKQLPQIKAMTDAKHRLHLKNLSRHVITSEKQALHLLRHGNGNRQVAETHLNEASSRSHCIFTIYINAKRPDTSSILSAKLHLVDLAGSERIGKSHDASRKIMSEGRNINLSLHHLQQVIVSLTKKKSTIQHHKHHHVPYRNSTMTLVLSDSLGGNSYTCMIATISPEHRHLEESISTCRFAQQVATISNKIIINESRDSELVIAKLREEVETLRRDLAQTAFSSNPPPTPTEADLNRLTELIQKYLEDQSDDAVLDVGTHQKQIQYCFQELKERLLEQLEENRRLQAAQNNKKSKSCVIL